MDNTIGLTTTSDYQRWLDGQAPYDDVLDRIAPGPPPPKKPPKPREADVLKAVLAYLKKQGIFHWRQNAGGAVYQNRRVSFAVPGVADIIGILPGGFFLAIEVKRPGRDGTARRRKERQERFAERVKAAGGVYLRATSVDDVRPVVEAFVRSFQVGQAFVSKETVDL